jgi:hypothetical protein
MALIASFALDIDLDSFVHFYYKYSYFGSARSARYYIEFVCACVRACVRACVKHSGRLIRVVRLRTGNKTKWRLSTGRRGVLCMRNCFCDCPIKKNFLLYPTRLPEVDVTS